LFVLVDAGDEFLRVVGGELTLEGVDGGVVALLELGETASS